MIFGLKADALDFIHQSTPYLFSEQRSKSQSASLSKLVISHQATHYADPRDKVYALLGLASDRSSSPGLSADYGKAPKHCFVTFCSSATTSRPRMLSVSATCFATFLDIRGGTIFLQSLFDESALTKPPSSKSFDAASLPVPRPRRKARVVLARYVARIREVYWVGEKATVLFEATISDDHLRPAEIRPIQHVARGSYIPFQYCDFVSPVRKINLTTHIQVREGDHIYQYMHSQLGIVARRSELQFVFVAFARKTPVNINYSNGCSKRLLTAPHSEDMLQGPDVRFALAPAGILSLSQALEKSLLDKHSE